MGGKFWRNIVDAGAATHAHTWYRMLCESHLYHSLCISLTLWSHYHAYHYACNVCMHKVKPYVIFLFGANKVAAIRGPLEHSPGKTFQR